MGKVNLVDVCCPNNAIYIYIYIYICVNMVAKTNFDRGHAHN